MMLLMYGPTSFHHHPVLTFREKIFASHRIGGIAGNILTALFIQKSITAADGTVIHPKEGLIVGGLGLISKDLPARPF
jgi:ammonia channel protein AmtB